MKSVFLTNFFEQKRTIESILVESRTSGAFYLLLSVSAFITTLGLLTNNAVIIIGGMLVAPLLFPILSLGMGVATSSSDAISRSLRVIVKSVAIVFFISFITSFMLNSKEVTDQMALASSSNLIFFLVAFASGIVAAYVWVKENISSTLPGIAVAVSLIPPLSLSGIALSFFSKDIFSGSITLFLINFLGIVLASTIVFSLFGFSGLQKMEEEKIQEEKHEEKVREAARREGKAAEKTRNS